MKYLGISICVQRIRKAVERGMAHGDRRFEQLGIVARDNLRDVGVRKTQLAFRGVGEPTGPSLPT